MRTLLLVALAAVAIGCLFVQHRRHARAVARSRARSYSPGAVARVSGVVETRGLEYPVLHGTWRGHRMRAELVPDTLGFRTVPTMWLVVQIACPHEPVDAVTILARGTGQEFFVPRHDDYQRLRSDLLPAQLTVARPRAEVRSPGAGSLATRLAALFEDDRLKLVDLAPAGVRIVMRAHQADPTTYRVTRAADFGDAKIGEEVWTLLGDVWEGLACARPARR